MFGFPDYAKMLFSPGKYFEKEPGKRVDVLREFKQAKAAFVLLAAFAFASSVFQTLRPSASYLYSWEGLWFLAPAGVFLFFCVIIPVALLFLSTPFLYLFAKFFKSKVDFEKVFAVSARVFSLAAMLLVLVFTVELFSAVLEELFFPVEPNSLEDGLNDSVRSWLVPASIALILWALYDWIIGFKKAARLSELKATACFASFIVFFGFFFWLASVL
jgi:hypothetical protein